ncbi:phytanoyl-CoA dioxygenase family protein [Aquiflexum sp.]|uniref:phytanoyl-CoA dioxygenase family protein n=1 Tax=Aquiflexum sp. TaxID=1872584 RepID=UPI0035931801
MKTQINQSQIDSFQENGFLVIEDFLSPEELENWRTVVTKAVKDRKGIKIPGTNIKVGDDDGVNKEDSNYFGNVFDQLLNLWQTSNEMKELMISEDIGKMAADLADVDGIRVWHDQALIKRPWANPTSWHLDTPFWSFSHKDALSIWIALDDATLENGCLYFIPGSHKKTTYENPGITKNMNSIFEFYPELAKTKSVSVPMKAGSASFHNGLCIHGAGPNMTNGFRRAMTCAFMPDGATFNGQKNILPDKVVAKLSIGDLLNDDAINPLLYKK